MSRLHVSLYRRYGRPTVRVPVTSSSYNMSFGMRPLAILWTWPSHRKRRWLSSMYMLKLEARSSTSVLVIYPARGVMHGRWQRQLSLTKHERRDYWPKTPCIDADNWKSRTIRVTKRPKFTPATHQAYAQKSLTMCYLRHANHCLYAIEEQDFPRL